MYSLYVSVLKSGLHTVYNIASYGDVGDRIIMLVACREVNV